MIHFTLLHPQMTQEALGFIPQFLSHLDPRPAAEQINEAYAHGGGWRPMGGWRAEPAANGVGSAIVHGLEFDEERHEPLAVATLRDETIYYYAFSWVAILDGVADTMEVGRLD